MLAFAVSPETTVKEVTIGQVHLTTHITLLRIGFNTRRGCPCNTLYRSIAGSSISV